MFTTPFSIGKEVATTTMNSYRNEGPTSEQRVKEKVNRRGKTVVKKNLSPSSSNLILFNKKLGNGGDKLMAD